MKKQLLLATVLMSSAIALPSFAASILNEKNISLELADQLAQHAIQACSVKNYNIAVTVVDRGGEVKVTKRMDNAGPHTVEASQKKAFTALSTKTPTDEVMKNSQENPGAQNLRDIPGFLVLGGGLPIKVGTQTIGAIGIGGAPGGHLDQQCAQDALGKIQAQLDAA